MTSIVITYSLDLAHNKPPRRAGLKLQVWLLLIRCYSCLLRLPVTEAHKWILAATSKTSQYYNWFLLVGWCTMDPQLNKFSKEYRFLWTPTGAVMGPYHSNTKGSRPQGNPPKDQDSERLWLKCKDFYHYMLELLPRPARKKRFRIAIAVGFIYL